MIGSSQTWRNWFVFRSCRLKLTQFLPGPAATNQCNYRTYNN